MLMISVHSDFAVARDDDSAAAVVVVEAGVVGGVNWVKVTFHMFVVVDPSLSQNSFGNFHCWKFLASVVLMMIHGTIHMSCRQIARIEYVDWNFHKLILVFSYISRVLHESRS